MKRILILLAALMCFERHAIAQGTDPENTLYLDLDYGRVVVRMRPDLAPNHVARIKHLVRGGFYDGMAFHRVVPNFAAQTGDPSGTGAGGTGRKLGPEFTRTAQVRGTVSMARTSKKDSADSQFFIVLADNRDALDGKYTAWGEVVSGMEFVDQLRKGDTRKDGRVADPDKLVRAQIAADALMPALTDTDAFKQSATAATARDFAAIEFRCSALADNAGIASQSALARLWMHGYLAGYASGQKNLSLTGEPVDGALRDVCKSNPSMFLLVAGMQELVKSPRALSATTAAFPVASYTCKDYTAARCGNEGAYADLWALAFVQGQKNVAQPGMEIGHADGARIMAPFAKFCAANPATNFVELAGMVAQKVKLK